MQSNRKKIKILYIITKSNWGGAQKYVYDLAISLPQEDFEVVVALGGNGVLQQKLESTGVRTVIIPSLERDIHIIKEFRTFQALFSIVRNEHPHIVHLNSSKVGILGTIAIRLYNLTPNTNNLKPRAIFTAHGWAFKEARRWYSRAVLAFLQWVTVLLSNQTIAVSSATKKEMSLPFTRRKMTTIKNGTGMPTFLTQEEARRELSNARGNSSEVRSIPPDALWVGTIAELTKNKGLQYALPAIAKLARSSAKPIVYFIIGGGELYEKLTQKILELGLTNTVFIVQKPENAAQHLKAFDIFLFPSVKEGLPYTLLEAGYAGIPTVASKVGGIPEIIVNKKTGVLVPPGNVHELHAALAEFATDEYKREILGKALARHITANFSIEQMTKETISIYKK